MRSTDVLIVGAGPVGLIMAHQLGKRGVTCLQIEAEADLSDEPRAVGLDPETLRSLQSLELLENLGPDILFGVTGDYINAAGTRLFALEDDKAGPLGYPFVSTFSQPRMVRTLAAELSRYTSVELLFSTKLLDFSQDEEGVTVRLQSATGGIEEVRTRYLVACDGGRSAVRTQLGIKMVGESNPFPWLVIDTQEAERNEKKTFRFFCDPSRPGMYLQTPHATRRWEWMILPGEDREAFLEDETIHGLLKDHIDLQNVDIFRRRVYDFHAIVAECFQYDRVFLAGDAAHMTPPFAGQGLNSGIRDVCNLGWKLALVVNDGAPAELLDSYESERWQHARELIEVALFLGEQIQPTDPQKAAERDASFAELNAQPADAMDGFVKSLSSAMLERSFDSGAAIAIGESFLSGRMLTQPVLTDETGNSLLMDEFLGDGFAIVGFGCNPRTEIATQTLTRWERQGAVVLSIAGPQSGLTLGEHGDVFAHQFSHDKHKLVLLRPDRFCMAAFTSADADQRLDEAANLIGLKR